MGRASVLGVNDLESDPTVEALADQARFIIAELAGQKATVAHCPESLLMVAVLDGAINDAVRPVRNVTHLNKRNAALDWMHVESDDWPFSFSAITARLSLEADYVRRGVLQHLSPVPLAVRREAERQDRPCAWEWLIPEDPEVPDDVPLAYAAVSARRWR